MTTQLHTECITCGHSIALGETYCGGDECQNRYSAENEHPTFSHFDWRQEVAAKSTDEGYHDWATNMAEQRGFDLDTLNSSDAVAERGWLV